MFSIRQELTELKKEETQEKAQQQKSEKERESLPKDDFGKHEFNVFWNNYLEALGKINIPVYNVLQTAEWKINDNESIDIVFDSEVMAIEFENIREDFVTSLRQALNNFYVNIHKKVNTAKKTKKHIKTRREIFEDLIAINSAVAKLKEVFNLDIDSEPK